MWDKEFHCILVLVPDMRTQSANTALISADHSPSAGFAAVGVHKTCRATDAVAGGCM